MKFVTGVILGFVAGYVVAMQVVAQTDVAVTKTLFGSLSDAPAGPFPVSPEWDDTEKVDWEDLDYRW